MQEAWSDVVAFTKWHSEAPHTAYTTRKYTAPHPRKALAYPEGPHGSYDNERLAMEVLRQSAFQAKGFATQNVYFCFFANT